MPLLHCAIDPRGFSAAALLWARVRAWNVLAGLAEHFPVVLTVCPTSLEPGQPQWNVPPLTANRRPGRHLAVPYVVPQPRHNHRSQVRPSRNTSVPVIHVVQRRLNVGLPTLAMNYDHAIDLIDEDRLRGS